MKINKINYKLANLREWIEMFYSDFKWTNDIREAVKISHIHQNYEPSQSKEHTVMAQEEYTLPQSKIDTDLYAYYLYLP